MIDRMLVVVFDTEERAYKGKNALFELETEGLITVCGSAVIAKNPDGTATVKHSDNAPAPLATILGTPLGSLIGLLGGPTGLAAGTVVGLLAGISVDLHNAKVGEDFVDDVKKDLLPNKFALVAEILEDWTTPVDTRMEAIGGAVFRRALSDVKHTLYDKHIAAMKADEAELKAEHAKARADRKARLAEKINQLDSKIQTHLETAKKQRLAAQAHAKAQAEILKNKAATLKTKAAGIHN